MRLGDALQGMASDSETSSWSAVGQVRRPCIVATLTKWP
jgi:hypothetical protein